MKRLHTNSQNFLRSPGLVKKLVGHSNLKKTDLVYDLGAGSGLISAVLAEKCREVVAIESDSRLIKTLHTNLDKHHNVSIQQADALKTALPNTPYKVFSNIPFHLSSPIVRRLTELDNPPAAIYLIVQKQFGQKLLIDNDNFTGLLGAYIAPLFTARIRVKLQRTDFWPHPAVDTVMIELLRRDTPLLPPSQMSAYRTFVERCFSRQKYFQTLGIGDKRPSQLTTEEWRDIFLSKHRSSGDPRP